MDGGGDRWAGRGFGCDFVSGLLVLVISFQFEYIRCDRVSTGRLPRAGSASCCDLGVRGVF